MYSNEEVSMDSLITLCNYSDDNGKFYSQLKERLSQMKVHPLLMLNSKSAKSLEELFHDAEISDSPQATAAFLHALLNSEVQDTFYKINVHAAMTPSEVEDQLKPAFSHAKVLKEKHDQQRVKLEANRMNTSSENTSRLSPLSETSSFVEDEDGLSIRSSEESTLSASASAAAPALTTTNKHNEVPFVTVRTLVIKKMHFILHSSCRYF